MCHFNILIQTSIFHPSSKDSHFVLLHHPSTAQPYLQRKLMIDYIDIALVITFCFSTNCMCRKIFLRWSKFESFLFKFSNHRGVWRNVIHMVLIFIYWMLFCYIRACDSHITCSMTKSAIQVYANQGLEIAHGTGLGCRIKVNCLPVGRGPAPRHWDTQHCSGLQ